LAALDGKQRRLPERQLLQSADDLPRIIHSSVTTQLDLGYSIALSQSTAMRNTILPQRRHQYSRPARLQYGAPRTGARELRTNLAYAVQAPEFDRLINRSGRQVPTIG
jgi:hypothetical protein